MKVLVNYRYTRDEVGIGITRPETTKMIDSRSDRCLREDFFRFVSNESIRLNKRYLEELKLYDEYIENIKKLTESTKESLPASITRIPPVKVVISNPRILWYLPENEQAHFDDMERN